MTPSCATAMADIAWNRALDDNNVSALLNVPSSLLLLLLLLLLFVFVPSMTVEDVVDVPKLIPLPAQMHPPVLVLAVVPPPPTPPLPVIVLVIIDINDGVVPPGFPLFRDGFTVVG